MEIKPKRELIRNKELQKITSINIRKKIFVLGWEGRQTNIEDIFPRTQISERFQL